MEQNMRFGMTLGWLAILNIVYLGNETIVHKTKMHFKNYVNPLCILRPDIGPLLLAWQKKVQPAFRIFVVSLSRKQRHLECC